MPFPIPNRSLQGWQLYGAYWYRLFEIDLMWIPAENYCRAMGGHLVSIRDRAENDFVHTLRKSKRMTKRERYKS
jgi:hypothetical protein